MVAKNSYKKIQACRIDSFVVMPNHFHTIVVIKQPPNTAENTGVGADSPVYPDYLAGEHIG